MARESVLRDGEWVGWTTGIHRIWGPGDQGEEHHLSLTQRLWPQLPLPVSPTSPRCPTAGHWVPAGRKGSLILLLPQLKTSWL